MFFLSPPPAAYVALAALVFSIGVGGVLMRCNVFIVLMSVELMLNAAHLVFAAFARMHGDVLGHAAILFGIAVAAAEICVGLAIVLAAFRLRETVDVDVWRNLKE